MTNTPQEKSDIAQGHARAWLKENESRLTSHQIAVVTDAIAMLTPDFYVEPDSKVTQARVQQLTQRLSCVLWKSDIVAAFKPVSQPIKVSWSEDMSHWIHGCMLGRS